MSARWGKLYKGTQAEHSLEPAVAALGLAYRTQFPGYLFGFRYFPDFFLPQLGLVIEVDDSSHNRAAKILEDAERTEALEARGWRVARCTNDEALTTPHEAVKACLADAGITERDMEAARRRPLAECLPVPGSAARKNKRAAKSAAIKRRRKKATDVKARICAPRPNCSIAGAARAGTANQDHAGRSGGGGGGRGEGSCGEATQIG